MDKSVVYAVGMFASGVVKLVCVQNTLESFQGFVGGYIEAHTIRAPYPGKEPIVVICDEEGLLKGYPDNVSIGGIPFVGDILVVGQSGEEFSDVPLWFVRDSGALYFK